MQIHLKKKTDLEHFQSKVVPPWISHTNSSESCMRAQQSHTKGTKISSNFWVNPPSKENPQQSHTKDTKISSCFWVYPSSKENRSTSALPSSCSFSDLWRNLAWLWEKNWAETICKSSTWNICRGNKNWNPGMELSFWWPTIQFDTEG